VFVLALIGTFENNVGRNNTRERERELA